MKLWPIIFGLVVLELVVFVLWMYSGAIDCHPHCTAYQDAVARGAWFVLPLTIIGFALYGVGRGVSRKRRSRTARG
jgi:hypothetical protein